LKRYTGFDAGIATDATDPQVAMNHILDVLQLLDPPTRMASGFFAKYFFQASQLASQETAG